MSWQEARALVARLERIWRPLKIIDWRVDVDNDKFFFCCRVGKEVSLIYNVIKGVPDISLEHDLNYAAICYELGKAYALCGAPDGLLPDKLDYYSQQVEPFAAQWMDFFRRGCWLSGCPIDASAHEKAEWMQGFTREELEAWKLKM